MYAGPLDPLQQAAGHHEVAWHGHNRFYRLTTLIRNDIEMCSSLRVNCVIRDPSARDRRSSLLAATPLGVRVRDEELKPVPLARHGFHGKWNYSIQPAADKPPPTAR
jgi:hypothetical protein